MKPSASCASAVCGKIPDRNDFARMPDAERRAAWRTVLERSRELGDAFGELVTGGRIREAARPL